MEVLPWKSFNNSHPHDLIFYEKEAVIHLNGCEEIFCYACSKSLADASFLCCGECYFFLHKTCAELPPMINHPWHDKHPLILHPNPPYGPGTPKCDMCGLDIGGSHYTCFYCRYNLDINCVMFARCFIQPESHKHHFTMWCRPDPFTCNFCGTYSKRSTYLLGLDFRPWTCTNCHVVVHNRCMSLPITVHLSQHDHPLIHTYFILETQSDGLICGICGKEVKREFGCYSCENCPHVVHVDCAMDNVQQVGQKFWAEEIEATEDQLLKQLQEVEHFSHPHHKLFLVQHDDHGIETRCDGCMSLMFRPFYKCLECEFSLHITCSKLPKKINHPLHKRHPLTLDPNNDNFIFYCRACKNPFNGFAYCCQTCIYFSIDVRCALVDPFKFYHDSHKHPLSVFTQNNKYSQCTSCGMECVDKHMLPYEDRHILQYKDKYMLRCKEQCLFALDYGCATLPPTVKYEYDEHPLVLSYHGNDDSDGFPYCDICEKDRDPNLWFYGCPNYTECPIYVHPKCAHGDRPYVKPLTARISSPWK